MRNIEKEFAEKPATQGEAAISPLQVWLADLKSRHIPMAVHNGKPVLGAGATDHDRLMADRFEWALSRALLWPDWFAFITGRRRTPPPMEYFPHVPDRASKDGKAFGCARCGWPAVRLDEFGLAWCKDHKADLAFEVPLFEETT